MECMLYRKHISNFLSKFYRNLTEKFRFPTLVIICLLGHSRKEKSELLRINIQTSFSFGQVARIKLVKVKHVLQGT